MVLTSGIHMVEVAAEGYKSDTIEIKIGENELLGNVDNFVVLDAGYNDSNCVLKKTDNLYEKDSNSSVTMEEAKKQYEDFEIKKENLIPIGQYEKIISMYKENMMQ